MNFVHSGFFGNGVGHGLLVAREHDDFFDSEFVQAFHDAERFRAEGVGERRDCEGGNRIAFAGTNPDAGFALSCERRGIQGDGIHADRAEFAEEAFASDDHPTPSDCRLGSFARRGLKICGGGKNHSKRRGTANNRMGERMLGF